MKSERTPPLGAVPPEASEEWLFQRSGQNIAYVWQGTQFEEREIEVGRRSGDKILISKGLRPGEQIALRDPTMK